ncbi:MAG: hypothetical protein RLZZ175_3197 [Bacteroidota bacterium]|jgi:hypothetical protein
MKRIRKTNLIKNLGLEYHYKNKKAHKPKFVGFTIIWYKAYSFTTLNTFSPLLLFTFTK